MLKIGWRSHSIIEGCQACWMMKGIAITNSNGNNNFIKNIINLKRKQENFNY